MKRLLTTMAVVCVWMMGAFHPVHAQAAPSEEAINACTKTIVQIYTTATSQYELESALQDTPAWCQSKFAAGAPLTRFQQLGCDEILRKRSLAGLAILQSQSLTEAATIAKSAGAFVPPACQAYGEAKQRAQEAEGRAQQEQWAAHRAAQEQAAIDEQNSLPAQQRRAINQAQNVYEHEKFVASSIAQCGPSHVECTYQQAVQEAWDKFQATCQSINPTMCGDYQK